LNDFMAPNLPHRGLWIGATLRTILGAQRIVAAGFYVRHAADAPGGARCSPSLPQWRFRARAVSPWPVSPRVVGAAPVLAQVYGRFFVAFALVRPAVAEAVIVPRMIVSTTF
jgi:hypothetical protein